MFFLVISDDGRDVRVNDSEIEHVIESAVHIESFVKLEGDIDHENLVRDNVEPVMKHDAKSGDDTLNDNKSINETFNASEVYRSIREDFDSHILIILFDIDLNRVFELF